MDARARVLVVCSLLVAAVAVVAAVVIWTGSDDEKTPSPDIEKAVVIDDLCAVVEPQVPAKLGLSGGQSTNDSPDGAERATCLLEGTGEAVLEVRVTSYDLPEGDADGELDQLAGATCDTVRQQFPVAYAEDSAGCGGQDSDVTDRPVLASGIKVATLPTLNAVVTVTLTDRDLPSAVTAYATAIAFGVVSSADELAG